MSLSIHPSGHGRGPHPLHPSVTSKEHPSVGPKQHPSVSSKESCETNSHSVEGETAASGSLIVRPWWDPDLAITGHPLDDRYIENFWLGVLGPSVICLLRRFSRGFESHPRGFRLSLSDTAKAIGLGSGTGRQAPINRTIDRACTFNIARRASTEEIYVRLHLPSLSSRQLSRLPLAVQNAHHRWMAENRGANLDSGNSAA